MSSQDTIHPCDNRVLSIRELMTLMTIPNSFQWTDHDDQLTVENSDEYLKENEGNIRRCIGEAVPTHIGNDIAEKIRIMLDYEDYVKKGEPDNKGNFLISAHHFFGEISPLEAFFEISRQKDDVNNVSVKIIGIRDFLSYAPQFLSYYSHVNSIKIDVFLQEEDKSINTLALLSNMKIGSNAHVSFQEKNTVFVLYNIIVEKGKCRPFFYTDDEMSPTVEIPQTDSLQLLLF